METRSKQQGASGLRHWSGFILRLLAGFALGALAGPIATFPLLLLSWETFEWASPLSEFIPLAPLLLGPVLGVAGAWAVGSPRGASAFAPERDPAEEDPRLPMLRSILLATLVAANAAAVPALLFLVIREDAGGLVKIGTTQFDISYEQLGTWCIDVAAIVAAACVGVLWQVQRRRRWMLWLGLIPLLTFASLLSLTWVLLMFIGM